MFPMLALEKEIEASVLSVLQLRDSLTPLFITTSGHAATIVVGPRVDRGPGVLDSVKLAPVGVKPLDDVPQRVSKNLAKRMLPSGGELGYN
jgi:hypothetical protein